MGDLPAGLRFRSEIEAREIAALICRSPESIDAYIAFAKVEAAALLAEHTGIVLDIASALLARRDRRDHHRSSLIEQVQAAAGKGATSARTSQLYSRIAAFRGC
jgi:hypothetical protein